MISASRHALGPPGRGRRIVRAGLIAALLLMLALPAAAGVARQAGAAAAAPVHFCYAWDFANLTGQDADDLHIFLRGVRQVTAAYAGEANPFGLPAATSGYDAALNAYRLDFAGGPAWVSDSVRLGVCTPAPSLELAAPPKSPPFYFSLQGTILDPPPLFAGLRWEMLATGDVRLTVLNQGKAPLALWSLNLLAAESPLALEDLTADALAVLPAVASFATEPVTIPAGGAESFVVEAVALQAPALPAPAGAWLVEMTVSAEDDLLNEAHLYSQAVALTQALYLPVIVR